MSAKSTVAIIGGGIIGLSTARLLQRDGHDVVVIERDEPGNGASFGNAGCLNPSSIVPMAMPGTLRNVPKWLLDPLGPLSIRWSYLPRLAPWLVRFVRAGQVDRVRAQAAALRGLLAPSVEGTRALAKEANAEDLIGRGGHLMVYTSKQKFMADGLAWQLREQNGVRFETLDADELRQFEPTLSQRYAFGVLFPDNGFVRNPNRLVRALAEAFVRDGGRLIKDEASGFVLEDGHLESVRTRSGLLPATRAVVAAGAHSRRLAAELDDRVPLETERGYHAIIRNPEIAPRVAIMDAERKFVATPMETGLRFAGTVELAGLEAPPRWERARSLLTHGLDMFRGLARTYPDDRVTTWMGHRPSLPDSLPAIGASQATRDVIYAFGHGHIGMTAAPATGQAVADLIAGRSPSIDLTPFSPARFR